MTPEELMNILLSDAPSDSIRKNEAELFRMIPELAHCKGFDQNNVWHVYDVYEHTLCVVDGVPREPALRLAALFHDTGKPQTYTEDADGVGHFYGHWDASAEIFEAFAEAYGIDDGLRSRVSRLIRYHDLNPDKLGESKLAVILGEFDAEGITELYLLKHADLMAQNPVFHGEMLPKQEEQKKRLLTAASSRQ